ncbi:hypothetical protein CASFOL_014659 [Castilleja foliolosa]|uniref:Uncharacterized protein n=1 Tax=Castilleja foliolosa TaxID=1961234 RepID=A0ABD3DDL9_9LAMI
MREKAVGKGLEKALDETELTLENIHSVEVVGARSHAPAFSRFWPSLFLKEPKRTMNVSECFSKGFALQSAILSPMFKVSKVS